MKFNYAASREQLLTPLPTRSRRVPLKPKNPPAMWHSADWAELGGGHEKCRKWQNCRTLTQSAMGGRKGNGRFGVRHFSKLECVFRTRQIDERTKGESSFPRLLLLLAKCRDSFLSPHLFHPLLGGTKNGSTTLKWGGFGRKLKKATIEKKVKK